MDKTFEPGGTYYIANDIVLDGLLAFRKGEEVVVEKVAPDKSRPKYRYVVHSSLRHKRYLLSDINLESRTPGSGEAPHETEFTNQADCFHKFAAMTDGSLICKQCGLNISKEGKRLPEIPKHCGECGEKVALGSVVCGKCGAPNAQYIQRVAVIENRDPKKCHHVYRYDSGSLQTIRIRCGRTVPLKTPQARKKYAVALSKSICIFCGAATSKDNSFCDKCGRAYVQIEPLPNKEYDLTIVSRLKSLLPNLWTSQLRG